MANGEGCFDRFVKLATSLGALAAVAALFVFSCQTCVFRDQLRVQREASNRTGVAQALTTIYDPRAPLRVREEAVRAYIAIQRDLGRPLRLRGADLSDMHFPRESFWNEDLPEEERRADLVGVKFLNSVLEGTVLTEADLREAEFRGAQLIGAVLRKADLTQAQFYDANLAGADLEGATLAGTLFSQDDSAALHSYYPANVSNVNFAGAVFDQNTWFCAVNACRARLANAKGFTSEHFTGCGRTPPVIDEDTTLPPEVSASGRPAARPR
jgi:uncharacterized protein YjbI with pentapeptide repeats